MRDLLDPSLLLGDSLAQLLVTVVTVCLWLLVDTAGRLYMRRNAEDSGLYRRQAATVVRIVRILTTVLVLAALAFVWGIGIEGVLLLATSVVTLTGVALFAQWSILSNITAYFVLLVRDEFQRGNFVRIVELDNFLEGRISDIGPFQTRLITEDRAVLLIPNNALLARAVFVNPRDRLGVAGKLPLVVAPAHADEPEAPRAGG
jgi:small-conductance mechanosensitive channel